MSEHSSPFSRLTAPAGCIERSVGPASLRSRALLRGLRLVGYPFVASWRPTRRGVWFLRRLFAALTSGPPVRGTRVERRRLRGVAVEWITTERARRVDERSRVILFVHGGGYVFGSARTHRNLASRLAHVTSMPVATVDYRMPPESSLRSSQDDVATAYVGLLELGYPAEAIVVVADSAGGGHATWLVASLVEHGMATPAALVLLSPWTDLSLSAESLHLNRRFDFLIVHSVLERIARVVVPAEAARDDWRNSPAHAPQALLQAFPPTLIQVGERESLRDDGLALARRLGEAGVIVEAQVYAGQGHVVPMWRGLPEARLALREIHQWLAQTLPRERRPDDLTMTVLEEAVGAGPDLP